MHKHIRFNHGHLTCLLLLFVGLPKEDLQVYIEILKKGQEGPVQINYDTLDVETAFFWRCLGEHAKSMGVDGEELLDELLPEVLAFCKYIQGYAQRRSP